MVIFPHFKPQEIRIWREFLARRRSHGRFEYDVKLPPPERPLRPFETPQEYRIWQILHSHRIDVVEYLPDRIRIYEVKDVLRKSAIGQLLFYDYWYRKIYEPKKPIELWIVAGEDDPMVREIAEKLGIKVSIMHIPTKRKRLVEELARFSPIK